METEEEQNKDVIDFIKSGRYPKMYRLVYADGSLSRDFHNRTRTREILNLSLRAQDKRK